MGGWKDWLHLLRASQEEVVKTSARANRQRPQHRLRNKLLREAYTGVASFSAGLGSPAVPRTPSSLGKMLADEQPRVHALGRLCGQPDTQRLRSGWNILRHLSCRIRSGWLRGSFLYFDRGILRKSVVSPERIP